MRLKKFKLVAYGHFENLAVDFSEEANSLHVIYGPNEAGKTTIKSAIEELLFDFQARTPYNFRFAYNELKLSATIINTAGTELEFIRAKRRSNSLEAPDGTPLAKDALAPYLGSLTREGFCSQFSLTREEMIKGSEDILAGKGELGASLYSAALGNRSLADIIKHLDDQAKGIFSRAKPLNKTIEMFDEARTIWRKAQIRPDAWKELVQEQQRVTLLVSDLDEQHGKLIATIALLERLRAQAPAFAALLSMRESLRERASEITVAPEQIEQAEAILAKRDEAELAIEAANGRIEELTLREDDTSGERLLSQDAKIRELTRQVGVYAKNRQDLENVGLQQKAAELHGEARQMLARVWPDLKLDQGRDRAISAAAAARGNELAMAFTGLVADIKTAHDSERRIKEEVEVIAAELAAFPPAQDVTQLRAAITTASAEGRIDTVISQMEMAVQQKTLVVDTQLKSLGLFTGDLDALAVAVLPQSETVARFRTEYDALRLNERGAQQHLETAKKTQKEAVKALEDLERSGALRTVVDLIERRMNRDATFDNLSKQWRSQASVAELDETAALYRPGVVAADELADELRANSERTATIVQLQDQRNLAQTEIIAAQKVLDDLSLTRTELNAAWHTEWASCGISPRPPDEMSGWLQKAGEIRRAIEALAEARATLLERIARRSQITTMLRSALELAGRQAAPSDLLEPVLEMANAVVSKVVQNESDCTRFQADIAGKTRESTRQQVNGRAAEAALEDWNASWSETLAAIWLPATLSAGAFADTVALVERFHKADREAGILTTRINSIERLNTQIRNAVIAFIKTEATDLTPVAETAPDAAMESLAQRLSAAKTAHDKREQRKELLDAQARALAKATANYAQAEAGAENLAGDLHIDVVVFAATVRRASEAHSLQQSFNSARETITSAIGLSFEQCEIEYGGRDRATIDSDLALATVKLGDLQTERDHLIEQRRDLDNNLAVMDTSRAAADAEGTLTAIGATIDQEGRRWASITLARYILDQQIREYTDKHQGPLVERSGSYFQQLTAGAYSKLRVITDDNKQILEAVMVDGTGVQIDGLSDGTRDQLYFALRLAALEEYFKENEPQPIILDDAFVQFDDGRTELAFGALDEFCRTTQVIYFTHHKACLTTAKRSVSATVLDVHELAPRWIDPVAAADAIIASVL